MKYRKPDADGAFEMRKAMLHNGNTAFPSQSGTQKTTGRSSDTALRAPAIGDRSIANETDVQPSVARYFPLQTGPVRSGHVADTVDLQG
jgi:hypothetical protein